MATPIGSAKFRQQADDERLLSQGISARRHPNDFVLALARRLDRLLAVAQDNGSVDVAMESFYAFLEASSVRLTPRAGLACRRGCDFCCTKLWVSVTAPEAFYLAKNIRHTEGAAAVASAAVTRRGLRHSERSSIRNPCPLLKDHACSAYAARPSNCRLAVSTSADICKRAYLDMTGEAIPIPGMFVGMAFVGQTALAAALTHRRLPTFAYELSAAVDRAVADPDLERRWLAGDDVFRDLERDTVDPGAGDNVRATVAIAFA